MPKIIINGSYLHEKPSGIGIYTFYLLKELLPLLIKEGWEVDLYAPHSSLRKDLPQEGYRYIPLPSSFSPREGTKGHIKRFLWLQTGFFKEVKKKNPDLFFSTSPEGIFLYGRKKQIITIHDVIPLVFPSANPKMRKHYQYTLPILIRHSKAMITVSNHTKKDILTYYPIARKKPIFVIYEGVDTSLFSPQKKKDLYKKYPFLKKFILFVGDMRPYKNLLRAIEAYFPFHKKVQFVIIGKKDPRFFPSIYQKVQELKIEDRVFFLDYIEKEELPFFYQEAECLFFPSLYEGFGLPPLEAIASGGVVAASNRASLPEVLEDSALYFDPENIEDMRRALQKILDNPSIKKELQEKGRKQIKNFSWKKTAEKHLEVFSHLL